MYRGHENESTAELESQFILRLPSEPAKVLREAIRNNSTLKDRITIKIENDMRHGEVRVDHWLMTGKVVDLPTIVESLKTIDGKGFYKTADICQMLLCREDDDTATTTTAPTTTTTTIVAAAANTAIATVGVTTATTNTTTNAANNITFHSTFNTAFNNAFNSFFNNHFGSASNTPNIVPNIISNTTNTTSNATPNTTNTTTNTTTTTTTTTVEEDAPQKKKKDSNKVEKKFLWPHGITPPSKNVRRRRFRKTLKKKYVEAPEIEKEVKRLFKSDNEAVSVKWEVINEDDENKINKGMVIKKDPNNGNKNVAEHDIFGGAVSDSEEEDTAVNVLELDENSQNSAEDSHLTDSNSVMNTSADSKILTEFSSDMFRELENSSTLLQEMEYYQQHQHSIISYTTQNLTKANIETRLEELDVELAIIKNRRQQQECKLETIENLTLRQRFQNILDRLYQEQLDKEQEKYELFELLKQAN